MVRSGLGYGSGNPDYRQRGSDHAVSETDNLVGESKCAHYGRRNDGSGDRSFTSTMAISSDDAWSVRDSCATARSLGPLRHHGVQRSPADDRNRRAHGAGGSATPSIA